MTKSEDRNVPGPNAIGIYNTVSLILFYNTSISPNGPFYESVEAIASNATEKEASKWLCLQQSGRVMRTFEEKLCVTKKEAGAVTENKKKGKKVCFSLYIFSKTLIFFSNVVNSG
jgi:hypothetical protein